MFISKPITISGLFLVFGLSNAIAQDTPEVVTTSITDNIHMLTGKGGNIGVLTGPDGTFVIDDQFAPMTAKILTAIESVGGETPKFLVNTHFHGDHTGGNENMGKLGTLLASHDNVRKRLENGSFIAPFGMKSPPAQKSALPVLTYSKDMHFHINDESIQAIHVANAHTDGDSFIHFKNANVIHTGDLFFNGFYPFIDTSHGGTLAGMINAADAMLALSDSATVIIPGHGPISNKAQLQAFRDMLGTAYERLLALKNQGVETKDAIARKPLKDLEAKWGGGIFNGDRWIDIIYNGVY